MFFYWRGNGWLLFLLLGVLVLTGPGAAVASDPIDVLVLYTPLAKQSLGGSHAAVVAAVTDEFVETNQAFVNSDLDASYRYEVAGVEEICFQERGKIRMDLQWLHESPHVAALREAQGADAVVLISGTANWGGMSWMIASNSANQREHAFATAEFFALSTLTVGHELGHIMGCSHNPEILVLPDPPVNSNYGYIHWQDEPYFRTLLAYSSFPDPDGPGTIECTECAANQLNVFSSPSVWYMYAGPGATLGELCTLRNNGNGTHAVSCPNGASGSIPSNDLESYGIPAGSSLSNNRAQVESRYDVTAAYYDPPLESGCAEDCAGLSRAGCTTAGGSCGGCLAGSVESQAGSCIASITPATATDFADGCYGDAGSFAPLDGSFIEETIDLGGLQALERVDLHFGTYDTATGLSSFAWAPYYFSNWSPPAPPPYQWELHASENGSSWTLLASGTRDTPAESLIGDSNGHHMMWRAWQSETPSGEFQARHLKVRVQACSETPCEYSVGLHEVEAYGTSVALVPALGLPAVALLGLMLSIAGIRCFRQLSHPS